MDNNTFETKLARYIDAGFPIIYINTYEEEKADRIIASISAGKDIVEWNEINGYVDLKTKYPEYSGEMTVSLDTMLEICKEPSALDRKVILLKDAIPYFDDHRIVSKIKGLAQMISHGADAVIIIVASSIVIPKELESYITILEMDYLNKDEIKQIIRDFISDNELEAIKENLIDEFATALKGLLNLR